MYQNGLVEALFVAHFSPSPVLPILGFPQVFAVGDHLGKDKIQMRIQIAQILWQLRTESAGNIFKNGIEKHGAKFVKMFVSRRCYAKCFAQPSRSIITQMRHIEFCGVTKKKSGRILQNSQYMQTFVALNRGITDINNR